MESHCDHVKPALAVVHGYSVEPVPVVGHADHIELVPVVGLSFITVYF